MIEFPDANQAAEASHYHQLRKGANEGANHSSPCLFNHTQKSFLTSVRAFSRANSDENAQPRHIGNHHTGRGHGASGHPVAPAAPVRRQECAVRLCAQQDGAGASLWRQPSRHWSQYNQQ